MASADTTECNQDRVEGASAAMESQDPTSFEKYMAGEYAKLEEIESLTGEARQAAIAAYEQACVTKILAQASSAQGSEESEGSDENKGERGMSD